MTEKIPSINIGVFGHIDHGKTTLLSKLTGKFTDTHSEELKRGITIKLGYADMTIYKNLNSGELTKEKTRNSKPEKYVSFIDAPGHEMLMATMLSGASIIDAAVLVIAASESFPQAQTKEHFMALQAKGINQIIIVQNKIDLVSKEQAMENYNQIKEFIKGTSSENAKIIPLSAQQGINIDILLKEICDIKTPKKDSETEPLFVIARSFDINKPRTNIKELHGGVLGGILKKGKLKVGDQIEIKPGIDVKKGNQIEYKTIKTKIISLHKGNENLKEVEPGASISVETSLDPSITKTDSLIGCVASIFGSLPEIKYKTKLKTKLFDKVLGTQEDKEVEEIQTKEMLMLSVNTAITVGTVEKTKDDEIELNLNIPIVPIKGENVGIARNINNHWRLIGWGEIIE